MKKWIIVRLFFCFILSLSICIPKALTRGVISVYSIIIFLSLPPFNIIIDNTIKTFPHKNDKNSRNINLSVGDGDNDSSWHFHYSSNYEISPSNTVFRDILSLGRIVYTVLFQRISFFWMIISSINKIWYIYINVLLQSIEDFSKSS